MRLVLSIVAASLLLTACGSRGPLFLPAEKPQEAQAQPEPQTADEETTEKKKDEQP